MRKATCAHDAFVLSEKKAVHRLPRSKREKRKRVLVVVSEEVKMETPACPYSKERKDSTFIRSCQVKKQPCLDERWKYRFKDCPVFLEEQKEKKSKGGEK